MKPKLAALNLLLAAIVGATIWQGELRWKEAQALRRSTLKVAVKPAPTPPLSPVPQPETPPATKYEEVAKKNLFSADRNDDIVVEPVKVEAPKPMPHLPVATGVMKLPSGVQAFMAEKAGEPVHAVKVDDKVGEFKIVALDEQNVTLEWNGKEIQKKIDDLIDRSNHQEASNSPGPAGPANPPLAPPPRPVEQTTQPTGHDSGQTLTPTSKACKPGDNSPAGTVEDGFRKTITPSIFGPVCRWVKQ